MRYSSTLPVGLSVVLGLICSCFADCRFGPYDFSVLDGSPWIVEDGNQTKTTYKISLCKELSAHVEQNCQQHTSVCKYTGTNIVQTIGNYTSAPNVTFHEEKAELWLVLKGAPCDEAPNDHYKSIFNFKCGKTLGSPKLLDAYACDTYFEWHTSAACRNPPTVNEVRCSVYDHDGNKRDLTPLVKQSGGYLVDSAGDRDFYINVCREITQDSSTAKCLSGSAACEIDGHGEPSDRGHPNSHLMVTGDGKLYLQYRSNKTPQGCSSPPTTSITFICPKRGGGRDPLLTSDLACNYDIEWQTEYACPEKQLVSHSCVLNEDQHRISIDLTPLKKNPYTEHRYMVSEEVLGEDPYKYYLNLCADVGIGCPTEKDDVAVCQLQGETGHVLGRTSHKTFRYSDGELTMTLRNGDKCSSHFQRETVINFHCDRNAAAGGLGWPEFNREESCTYIFDWNTTHACLEHALPTQCNVKHGSQRYDLSPLMKEKDGNWEALRATHLPEDTDDDRYFLNICNKVLHVGGADGCPSGSAACLRDKSGQHKNLGEYVASPEFDPESKHILLHYKNGDTCGDGKKRETFVRLLCKPGDLESAPELVSKSSDECVYEFVWETAAACALSKQQGTDCSVVDDEAGYSIDLSRLQKKGTEAYYKIASNSSDGNYYYYINVCGEASGSPCQQSGTPNVGVCQAKMDNPSQSVSTGESSRVLHYYNGMVNLTYTNGAMYHSTPPRPRASEIAFLCDRDAGVGSPEYVREADYTYRFIWMTSYVCPQVPVECVATDANTNQQYDLSELGLSASGGNWIVTSADLPRKKILLNVCRPVNPVTEAARCDPTASACLSTQVEGEDESVLTNLGRVETGPTIESEGQLLLTYKHGAPCTRANGSSTTYTTKIHLRCLPGAINHAPTLLHQGECEFVFLWSTAKACPLGSETPDTTPHKNDTEECTVRDRNSDFVFNMGPLRRKDSALAYTVTSGGRTFMLNVCGGVNRVGCEAIDGKPSAVCEGSKSLGGVNTQLEISDNGRVSLTYPGRRLDNGEKSDVVITFECYKDAIEGPVTLTHAGDERLEFTFQTALACGPQPVDCIATDSQGRQYDLSVLAKKRENWNVVDLRQGHGDLKYYINVCHQLNPILGASCPGGAIGGCQQDGSGKAYNLGYIQSKPIAAADGSLSIRYLGGDVCHQGTPNQNYRSVRILFECADTQHPPVFQSETAYCEYVFTWETPSACPLKRVSGGECKVTEPLYHVTFDLSHLQKVGDHDYSITAGQYKYSLNVCGPLNNASGECSGAAACQTRVQTDGSVSYVNTGMVSRTLKYNDGELSLTYGGGKGPCHAKFNRTTVITFVCDHATYGSAGPTFINETGECTYMFEWRTSLACMPFQMSDCSIQKVDGPLYDLSSLTLTGNNYIYISGSRKYLINVCTTVVHRQGVTCPPNSAACYIDTDQTDPLKKYVKLGEPSGRSLDFDDENNLRLTYHNGQNCSGSPRRQHKTVITFHCKADAIDSSPIMMYAEDDCVFYFTWETRAACNIPEISTSTDNCTVKNPATGYTYNLAALSKTEGYTITDQHNHLLKINICAPVSGTDCSPDMGACQSEVGGENRHWNAGRANGDLHFTDGDLYLNYSLGDPCHHNNLTRNTIINFVCAAEGVGQGSPVYVDEDGDCNYFVSWHTELVCEKHVRCEVPDDHGNLLDLSPLVRGSGYHLAINTAGGTEGGATYYINVCRPLNPIQGTLCPPQAAACKVIAGKPTSLGRVEQTPFFDRYSRRVISVYDHGSPCEKNNGKTNSSSRIMFVCKPGALGQPRLELVTEDCQYQFEWETEVVCIETKPVTTQYCRYMDVKTNHQYDLTALKNKTMGYKVSSRLGTFYVNLCDKVSDPALPQSGCDDGAVCLVDSSGSVTSYGLPTTQQFKMEGSEIKVSYKEGHTCANSRTSSHFLLECNERMQGLGSPEIFSISDDNCTVVFSWLTPLACTPVRKDCTVASGGNVYDLQILSRDTGAWNVTDPAGNTYFINVCEGIHGGPQSPDCPANAAACRKNDMGTVDMIGIVQSQRISVAGDGTVILEYSQGSTEACAQRRRKRGQEEAASMRIRFVCADTVGYPVYVPRKGDLDSCVFEFKWKSRVACKEERIPVAEVNGILTDPRSGGTIHLNKIENNLDKILRGPESSYIYSINLHGTVNPTNTGGQCINASVCQTRIGTKTSTDLGDRASRKFYMEDDVVEAVFSSSTACAFDPKRTTSAVIVFHCQKDGPNKTEPVFLDSARSCVYLFDWYTQHACIDYSTHVPDGSIRDKGTRNTPSGNSPSHINTAGVVIGVLVLVVLILVLVGVFYKPERRRSFRHGIIRIFQRGPGGRLIKYSTLSSLDEDESLIPDNSSNSQLEHHPRMPTLTSDESDEDLIL